MKTKKILLIFAAMTICLLAVLLFPSAAADQPKKVDVLPDVQLARIDANVQLALLKLDAAAVQLNDISVRLQRIEEVLRIKPPVPPDPIPLELQKKQMTED